jgi:putative DNA primase/helicase
MTETAREAARRLSQGMIDKGYKPKALHEYTNPDGTVAYHRIRLEHLATGDKYIRPMRHDGARFVLGEPAFMRKKPLYRLHLLYQRRDEPVYLVEGEKCVDDLEKRGVLATTSGGANTLEAADFEPLAGRETRLWRDNDEAGKRWAATAIRILEALGCEVWEVQIDKLDLPPKGDCVDWLMANPSATADDILGLPTTTSVWPEPQPLIAKIAPEPYPIDALPEALRAAIEEVVGFVKAPIPLVASTALGALSLAIQAHVDVQRAQKLEGPTGLFLLTIADSGERKSTCDGFFTKAIWQYQDEQAEALKPELELYKAAVDVWNVMRDGLLAAIKDAVKKEESTEELQADLEKLQYEKPEPPRVPRLLLGDETPESLAWSLGKQWPSSGVVSSEAGLVFGAHGMGKDSVMRNLTLLNVLWDGGIHSVGRRTSECYTVKNARLTVALQVQEPTLREFCDRTGTLARGTGFLARFLVSWPESTQGFRPFTDPPESWPHLSKFNERIGEILRREISMDENGVLTPLMLSMGADAKAVWVEFHDTIERELVSPGELYDVRDVASKAADNVARLAALLHVFISKNSNFSNSISAECIEAAARIVAWHLNESRRFFCELALPEELVDAARLDAWLIGYCKEKQTHLVPITQVQQRGPNGLRKKQAIETAMYELEEAGRARRIEDGKRRMIAVNPALLIEGGK